MKLKAVLFDMDGVLMDSEPVITEACVRALRGIGVPALHGDFKPFTGMGEDRFIGGVMEKYGEKYDVSVKKAAYDIYLSIVDEKLERFPRARGVIEELISLGYSVVLASAADRIKVDANLRAAGIPQELFTAVLSAEDVENKKPAPDIYIKAAEKAGALPSRCVVVEDAISGVKAAREAGARCVGVTTSFDGQTLLEAGANAVCGGLGELVSLIGRVMEE